MKKEDWRTRFDKALKARKKTMRSVSIGAGRSKGYLFGLLKEEKSPSINNLTLACDAAGISLCYVVSGIEMTPIQEKFLRLLADLDQEDQENLLKVVQRVRAGAVRT